MDTSLQLILICSVIIVAYLFELIAKRTKIPAVLLLISLGILLRQLSDYFDIFSFDFELIIPALGTFGLILIVFEGALELDYEKQKNRIIRNAGWSSLIILLATSVALALFFQWNFGQSLHVSLVNAIPLSIISSAIAIPSVVRMSKQTREFITYESTFSDILGIVFFNYVVTNSVLNGKIFLQLGTELVLVILLSMITILLLMFLLKKITHTVKFIMIITVMVLMFAFGKYFHLSSLILVLAFGLFLRNFNLFTWDKFRKLFHYEQFDKDFGLLHQITAEGVFLIKTFFFVIFGFIIDFQELATTQTLIISLIILGFIFLIRAGFIRVITGHFLPETFISPRGLITILLFLSIPDELKIPGIGSGVLFVVVLASSLMMILSGKSGTDRLNNP